MRKSNKRLVIILCAVYNNMSERRRVPHSGLCPMGELYEGGDIYALVLKNEKAHLKHRLVTVLGKNK